MSAELRPSSANWYSSRRWSLALCLRVEAARLSETGLRKNHGRCITAIKEDKWQGERRRWVYRTPARPSSMRHTLCDDVSAWPGSRVGRSCGGGPGGQSGSSPRSDSPLLKVGQLWLEDGWFKRKKNREGEIEKAILVIPVETDIPLRELELQTSYSTHDLCEWEIKQPGFTSARL